MVTKLSKGILYKSFIVIPGHSTINDLLTSLFNNPLGLLTSSSFSLVMKPRYLYHGSSANIKGNLLKPHRPGDTHKSENCERAVYATERKDIAIGMSLTAQKYSRSFSDYEQNPVKIIFTRGYPKRKYTYLYVVSSKTFTHNSLHQWVSVKPVKIVKKTKLKVQDLSSYWRLATPQERKWFFKMVK